MFSLIKILKALNSSQASYQLSLALVFGMISGFLPFFSILNLFIIFIVFTLNIPIGVFSIFTLLFSLLAVTLDPTFASIGYEILQNPSLNTLWTSMYNNPIALWFNFNHTITMGSFISAMILAIPLYFISKVIFIKYRVVLENKFKNSKFFSWLNPYSEKKLAKKPGLIRWWGSGLFIVILSLIILFFLLLLDPVIKFSVQYLSSKFTNSSITISDVTTNISDGTIKISTIESIKDKQQTATIKQISININNDNLLRKKIDIELIDIKDINLISKEIDLKNNTNLPLVKKNKDSINIPEINIDFPNIDTILSKEDLNSLKEAKKIKKQISDIKNKWKNISKNDLNSDYSKDLKKDYKEIETLALNTKTPENAKKLIKKIKLLKNKIKKLKSKLNTYKEIYKKDTYTLKTAYKSAKTLPLKDYHYLSNKYTVDQNGALNIVSTYISEDLAKYTKLFTEYYALIKPYLPKNEEIEIVREEGQFIKYIQTNPYPSFTLQKLNLNIIKKDGTYTIKASNISDDFKILKKYPIIHITGKSNNFRSLSSTIIHTDKTSINTEVKGINSKKIDINKYLYLDNNNININSNIIIEDFEKVTASINSKFVKTHFNFINSKNKSEKIVSNILSKINSFYINSKINTSVSNTNDIKFKIKSDLDNALKDGFTNEIKKQTLEYKAKLKKKLSSKIRSELGNMSQEDFDSYSSLLNDKDNLLNNISDNLKKKYSKEKLVEKSSNKVKEKLEEKLKNKFKSLF